MVEKSLAQVFCKMPNEMDVSHPDADWEQDWPYVLQTIEKTMPAGKRFYIHTSDNRVLSHPSNTEDCDIYSSFLDYFGDYTPYPAEIGQDRNGDLYITMCDSDGSKSQWVVRFGKPDYMESQFDGEYEIGFQEAKHNRTATKLWNKLDPCYPAQRVADAQNYTRVCDKVCATLEERSRNDSVVRLQYKYSELSNDGKIIFHFTFGKVRIECETVLHGLTVKKVFTSLYKRMEEGAEEKNAIRDFMNAIDDSWTAMSDVECFITDWIREESSIEQIANYGA